jgi:uncharacterized membrane protein
VRGGFRVGIWVLGLASWLWVLAILAAPLAADSPHRTLAFSAAVVYAAGSNVCHQRPDRSFHIAGHKMPVCARCTGLYVSAAAALPAALLLAVPLSAPRARRILLLAALPTALTWGLEYAGVMAFGNMTRAVAALPLGWAAAWLIVTQGRIERSNG